MKLFSLSHTHTYVCRLQEFWGVKQYRWKNWKLRRK